MVTSTEIIDMKTCVGLIFVVQLVFWNEKGLKEPKNDFENVNDL